MKTNWLIGLLVIIILALGAWYFLMPKNIPTDTGADTNAGINGSDNQGNLGGTDTSTVQQPGADGQEDSVIGDNLALGVDGAAGNQHLIGYTGMTVYTYAKDVASTSKCYDACATNWPPYIVSSVDNLEQIQAGINDSLVGTTIRSDGQLQLTYKGHPLYFYIGDKTGSDTNGAKIANWTLVTP